MKKLVRKTDAPSEVSYFLDKEYVCSIIKEGPKTFRIVTKKWRDHNTYTTRFFAEKAALPEGVHTTYTDRPLSGEALSQSATRGGRKRTMNPILAAERKRPGSGRVKLLVLLETSRWSANMAATNLKCSVWSILRMIQRFDLSEEWAGRAEKPNHWSRQ